MRELSFVEAAREGLSEEMARDASIFVVGEGIGPRGGNFNTTVGLYDVYGPERLRDAPISERGFTALCTGAAACGARPSSPKPSPEPSRRRSTGAGGFDVAQPPAARR